MVGLEQFLSIFGNITVSKIVGLCLACIFAFGIYKQVKKFFDGRKELLIQKYEAETKKNEELAFVLAEVKKYPEYREQSRQIQKSFQEQIDLLKESQTEMKEIQQSIKDGLNELKEELKERDKNKLQDRLLQSYFYYTDIEKNPAQTIDSMASFAFWKLFEDYENLGGDGFMHEKVLPAMKKLKVVDKA